MSQDEALNDDEYVPGAEDTLPFDSDDGDDGFDEDYEEISSDEVDRVVASLEDLIEGVDSENIRLHLEEALEQVYHLVYEDETDDGTSDVADAA